MFEKAIVKSANITKKFNSEFIFVYLPWQNNYTINKEHSLKKEVFKILDTKKINYIDVDKIFKKIKTHQIFIIIIKFTLMKLDSRKFQIILSITF